MTKYMLSIISLFLLVSDHGASAQEQNLRRREQVRNIFTSIDGSSIDNDRDPEVFSANIDAALLLDKEGPLYKSQTCQTYSMSFYNSNYNTPEIEAIVPYAGTFPYRAQQWGRHALQWKGYTYESQSFLNFYDAAFAGALNWAGFYAFPSTPIFTVGANDAADLNSLEQALPQHFGSTAEVNGVPVTQGLYRTSIYPWQPPATISEDPPGTWMSDFATGPVNGAILAAIYMHLWNTPVYANAYNAYPSSVTKVGQFVFEKVRLCVSGTQAPHIACGWNNYATAINQNSGGSGYNCANNANLSLNSVTFRFFPYELPFATVFNQWLTPSITIPGGNWATSGFWGCAGGGSVNCPIVFDPPVQDESAGKPITITKEGLNNLKKRASAMEERTYVPVFSKELEYKGLKLAKEVVIPVGKEKHIHPRYSKIKEGPADIFKNDKRPVKEEKLEGEKGESWERTP